MHVGVCGRYGAVLRHERHPDGAAEEGVAVPSVAGDLLAAQQVGREQGSGRVPWLENACSVVMTMDHTYINFQLVGASCLVGRQAFF
uniref:Uncharacterized protein n=1 Tax=Arundo donax TaxID=35708 RepID=A0A0A9AAE8_ARUDO